MDKRVVRTQVIRAIRSYFEGQGFLEVDTPTLVLSPGMEPHIRPATVHGGGSDHSGRAFLATSPEFAMKKLIAQGHRNIFQICRAYRAEPKSSTHNPEFSILEWYRTPGGYEDIMNDVEALFKHVACEVGEPKDVSFSGEWPRLSVEECFREFAGVELGRAQTVEALHAECVRLGFARTSDLSGRTQWDDLFFLIMMNCVEPALEKMNRAVIVRDYPESQAALSNTFKDSHDITWAKRFEVYAGGLELGNAFDELTDAKEQERRFKKDMRLREELYGIDFPASPIDPEFLRAIAKMPATGGIAMGVDRIAMLFAGTRDIRDVLWGESHWDLISTELARRR